MLVALQAETCPLRGRTHGGLVWQGDRMRDRGIDNITLMVWPKSAHVCFMVHKRAKLFV